MTNSPPRGRDHVCDEVYPCRAPGAGYQRFPSVHPVASGAAALRLQDRPKTPLADLLPRPPESPRGALPWLVKDLTEVPEIQFEKAVTPKEETLPADFPKMSKEQQEKALSELGTHREAAAKRTAHAIAKINHLNQKEVDH